MYLMAYQWLIDKTKAIIKLLATPVNKIWRLLQLKIWRLLQLSLLIDAFSLRIPTFD